MSGTEDRLRELVCDYGQRVYAYLLRRCATPHDASDAFQSVLITVWRKLDKVPTGDPLPWLITVARNELANQRRAQRRQRAAIDRLRAERHEVDQAPGRSADPRADALRRAVSEMPEHDRELVRLTYWDELTSDQAATALGISPAAARKRLQRARTRLAAVVADAPPDPDVDGLMELEFADHVRRTGQ